MQIIEIWKTPTGITDLTSLEKTMSFSELRSIASIWHEQNERLKGSEQLRLFNERMGREWAIETGIIENVYDLSLGATQTLIEQGFRAELLSYGDTNKDKQFVVQLLKDHFDAYEGMFDFINGRRNISVSYIKELHSALLRSQTFVDAVDPNGVPIKVSLIRGDWKKLPNFPVRDEIQFNYCPPEQVASEMDRLMEMHYHHIEDSLAPEVQAAWLHHRFSQIHPFQDGNGRVARTLASLVLIRAELFPLVVTRNDRTKYIDALETADKNGITSLVDLFARLQRVQFRRATAIAEDVLDAGSALKRAVALMNEKVEQRKQERQRYHSDAIERSQIFENRVFEKLEEIKQDIGKILFRADPTNRLYVNRSNDSNDFYYKFQIIEIANKYLDYYANTRVYRSWIRLKAKGKITFQLIFTFHGSGGGLSGVIACAPFIEFQSQDIDEPPQTLLRNIVEEPFELFSDELISDIKPRFERWMNTAVLTALGEIYKEL